MIYYSVFLDHSVPLTDIFKLEVDSVTGDFIVVDTL